MGARIDNTVVIIPSHNEARTIGQIVRDIVNMGLSALVIDDGSIDNTERIALDNGAMVIRQKTNLGKGASVREGIRHVLAKTNFEWMVMMDGDGQHHIEDITVLMSAAGSEDVDIVIGNRMQQTKNMPLSRYWVNRVTSWIISRMCGQDIPDTQCGYRLIKVEALKKLKIKSEKYDIESEMLMLASGKNMKIKSVPIRTIYGEEISGISPARDTLKFFMLVFKYIFNQNKRR
ncbi:MAG: glycosyltransferase family 2 protein [Candidatus Omnitrophota bacterium]